MGFNIYFKILVYFGFLYIFLINLSFGKCNIDTSWMSEIENIGVFWFFCNSLGEFLLYSRRFFFIIFIKFEAEFLSFLWVIDCFSDLRFG